MLQTTFSVILVDGIVFVMSWQSVSGNISWFVPVELVLYCKRLSSCFVILWQRPFIHLIHVDTTWLHKMLITYSFVYQYILSVHLCAINGIHLIKFNALWSFTLYVGQGNANSSSSNNNNINNNNNFNNFNNIITIKNNDNSNNTVYLYNSLVVHLYII